MLDKKTKPLQIFFVLGIVLLALSYAMKDTSITDKSFASGLFNQVGFIIENSEKPLLIDSFKYY